MSLELVHEVTTTVHELVQNDDPVAPRDLAPDGGIRPVLEWASPDSNLYVMSASYPSMVFVPAHGLIVPSPELALWTLRLDGAFSRLTNTGGARFAGVGWDLRRGIIFAVDYGGQSSATIRLPAGYRVHELGWNNADVIVADDGLASGQRGLRFSSYRIYWGTVDGSDAGLCWPLEFEFDDFDQTYSPRSLCPTRDFGVLWAMESNSGQIASYDYHAKAEGPFARRWITPGWLRATYSPKHDVFLAFYGVSGTAPYTLRIFANETKAHALSSPVFSAPPALGSRRSVSVSLTGDHGEACEGRIIRFEATIGSVSPATAVTDALGVATADYVAPQQAGDDVTVTATLDE